MLFRWAILIPLVLCGVSAQTRTVCEALADLTDLNGHEVKIRGAFIRGDTGQELFAWPPCPQPTVRDGWVWRDIIQVWPVDGQGSVTGALATYHEMAKAHRDCDIVVTLEGRLETRDHFDSKLYGDGLLHPIGF